MPTIKPLLFDNYLAVINGAPGSRMFRKFYALVDGKKKEVSENGNLSCGWFVAFILKYFSLIQEPHMTVDGTLRDMEASGWKKIEKPKIGCIILWDTQDDRRSKAFSYGHRHMGFYIGKDKAISNLSSKGVPGQHHWTFGKKSGKPARRVESMWWHPILDS
jgi:hypothetical protein